MFKSLTVALFAVTAVSTTVGSQVRDMRGANPLRARVHVATVAISGDTVILGYRAAVLTTGDESLWGVLVDNPADVEYLRAPARQQWALHDNYRDRSSGLWMNDGDVLTKPGDSTGVLVLASRGLPGIVSYWAIPDLATHAPVETDETEDPYRTYGDSGSTVGIEPPPSAERSVLLDRLTTFLHRACTELGWIDVSGICESLDAKLSAASRAVASGELSAAVGALEAFAAELKAQSGSGLGDHVSPNALALLWPNAAYLAARLR